MKAHETKIQMLDESEVSQALARFVIVSLVALYLGGLVIMTEQPPEIVRIGAYAAIYCPIAGIWWYFVRRNAVPFSEAQWRIYLGIFGDTAMTGVFVSIGGPELFPMYIVYLWVILGNGMRFGAQTMAAATAASMISFSLAALVSPRWVLSPVATFLFLGGLLIVDMFARKIIRERDNARELARKLLLDLQEARLDGTASGILDKSTFLDRVDAEVEGLNDGSVLAAIVVRYEGDKANLLSNPHSEIGREASNHISSELRGSDIATFGSENEVWLLVEPKRQSDAQAVSRRVAKVFERFDRDARPRTGVAIYPMVKTDALGLFAAARENAGFAGKAARRHLSIVNEGEGPEG